MSKKKQAKQEKRTARELALVSAVKEAAEQGRKDREYAAWCKNQWHEYSKKYHAISQLRRTDIIAIKSDIVRRNWSWGSESVGFATGLDHGQPTFNKRAWLTTPLIGPEYEYVGDGGPNEALAKLYARVKFEHEVAERVGATKND